MLRGTFVTALLVLCTTLSLFAQQESGFPAFNTFISVAPHVTVNAGSLDVHVSIPIYKRQGRGLSFAYTWEYDNELWWDSSSGWQLSEPPEGFDGSPVQYVLKVVYASATYGQCADGAWSYQESNFRWTDPSNTVHSFPSIKVQNDCGPWPRTGSGSDSAGWLMQVNDTTQPSIITITSPNGVVYKDASTADANGNTLTNTSGPVSTYYDTLGQVLQSNGLSYTYTGESGSESVTKTILSTAQFATAFGCTGPQNTTVNNEKQVSGFNLPDGSNYAMTYEPTPGNTAYSTGRIKTFKLPTGGNITFTYNGSNYGMNCDGSTSGMTIATPDGNWTFTHTVPNSNHVSTTTVVDPAKNKTVYNFYQNGSVGPYETQRQIYTYLSSTATYTLSETVVTCYNGQAESGCAATPGALSAPPTEVSQYDMLSWASGGSQNNRTDSFYTSSGLLYENDYYDWGALGNSIVIVKKESFAYGTYNAGTCSALPNNIQTTVCIHKVMNGSGTTYLQENNTYDNAGNHLSWAVTTGGVTLTKSWLYNTNGTVSTYTDVNNDQYSYGYADCNGAFPTSINEPAALSVSMSWDCNGGVLGSITDEAGGTTTITHSGEYFWRADASSDPLGNVTKYYYTPTTFEAVLPVIAGTATVDHIITFDGLGRKHVDQQRQGPGSSYFDTVETDYSVGRVSRVTMPYQGTVGQTAPAASAATYTYDGVGRVLTMTDGGGGQLSYSYTGNMIFASVSGVVTWASDFNGIGETIDVCEEFPTGTTGTGTCSGLTGGANNGYWTQYGYDPLGDLTSVTQNKQSANPQTRSYSYDALQRLTSENTPEGGNVVYSYDTLTHGDVYTVANAIGTLTYHYGPLHRVNQVGNGSECRNFYYDSTGAHSGATYTLGRMTGAQTSDCTNVKTQEYFSYDKDGRITDLWEFTPNSGGSYHVTEQYYPNGAINTLVARNANDAAFAGLPDFNYGVDNEGRTTTVSASSGLNPVTAAVYDTASNTPTSAGKLGSLTYGSGDSDSYSWSSATGRMTQYQFSINGSNVTGALTYNANGTVKQLAITDPFNSNDAQTCSYGYDQIMRLTSVGCTGTSAWSQTFTYDFAGNIKKSGTLSFQPNYTDANGNTSNRYYSGLPNLNYDAAGHLLNDSFHTYTWDAFGGMTAIDSYPITHDAFGRIVEFKSNPTYQVLYAPSGIDLAVMNSQVIFYGKVPLPGRGRAVYVGSGFNDYTHSDWLGSARFGSKADRTMLFDMAYAPFGEIYAKTGGGSAEAFTGQFRDIVSDTWDFLYRAENSAQGRWISPDPAGLAAVNPMNPQTWNRYTYAGNNPLVLIDPLGLLDCMSDILADSLCQAYGTPPESFQDSSSTVVEWVDDTPTSSSGEAMKAFELDAINQSSFSEVIRSLLNKWRQNTVSKHYGLSTPCGSSAPQVMGAVEGNFAQFGNYSRWGGLESVTFFPPPGMRPGSTIPITVNVFGITQNLSANVQSMSSQSMTFTTNPGHLLYPASITFSSSPASPGTIDFNINLGGTVANPAQFTFGGSAFEDAQWNHFLGKVGGFCKAGG